MIIHVLDLYMYDVNILTQNEAIGARPPPLAVAGFGLELRRNSCINSKTGV